MKFHLTLQEANTLIDRAFVAGYIDDFIIHELTKRGIYEAWLAETDSLEGYRLKIGENRYLYLDFVDDFVANLKDNILVLIDKRVELATKCSSERNRAKAYIFSLFKAIVTYKSPNDLKDLKECITSLNILLLSMKHSTGFEFIDTVINESINEIMDYLNNLYKTLNMEG